MLLNSSVITLKVAGEDLHTKVMPAETSIGVSKDTLKLLKANKEYPSQSYDELLRSVFDDDNDGDTGS